jgi:hypothetical protein
MTLRLVVDNASATVRATPSNEDAFTVTLDAVKSFQALLRLNARGELTDADTLKALYGALDHEELEEAVEVLDRRSARSR